MIDWYVAWLKEKFITIISYILILSVIVLLGFLLSDKPKPTPDTLKDFKDGIQNHLVWSIKGECFFVRPHAETTVYLIRVADCDRK
jgi:hypothetical protein